MSSVLNRDAKQFGKKHMFDASEETCWNSDQVSCTGDPLCLLCRGNHGKWSDGTSTRGSKRPV